MFSCACSLVCALSGCSLRGCSLVGFIFVGVLAVGDPFLWLFSCVGSLGGVFVGVILMVLAFVCSLSGVILCVFS